MNPLIIIVGPTAVGKSALGLALALKLDGEIISGDSVQIYRMLNIGSAKPTSEELSLVPHHLIDFLEPDEPFTVAQFQALAGQLIREIQERGHIPIIVGGTGLYIRSLLDPFDFLEEGSTVVREKWTKYLADYGNQALHQALKERDPQSAERLHPNDTVRIIRALEVYELTGEPFSLVRGNKDRVYSPLDPSVIYVGLTAPREIIYERINERCAKMIEKGLLEETLNIIKSGYSPKLKPLQSIGYRHALWYLSGKATITEMMRIFKRDTRRFAKRQLTWFRRDPRIKWYDITRISMTDILEDIANTCRALKTRVQ